MATNTKHGTWSEAARRVLRERYLWRKDGQFVEDEDAMCRRVAEAVAAAEEAWGDPAMSPAQAASAFGEILVERRFMPNSPTLMNAGKGNGQQLSACFVLPISDDMEGIFDAVKQAAMIHKSGGGTGFSFSRLRPEGSMVSSTAGVASGPVSFMKVFDAATEHVKQGGCVVPETLVTTNRGVVPICELGPVDAPADSWHRHGMPLVVATDDGPRASDEFYHHGVAPIRRIRTRAGYHLAATLEHRIRVIDEGGHYVWRQVKDLKPGEWAVLQKGHLLEPEDYSLPSLAVEPHSNAAPVRLPTEASGRLGEFIGSVVGDGSFNRYNRGGSTGRLILSVADDEPDVAAWLIRTSRELFGIAPIVNKKENDGSTNYYLNATTLVNWLHQIGVEKPSALVARVPPIVFRKGIQMARGFVRGLFTADGTVSEAGYPSLASVSEALIDDVQQLLLAIGIPSSVSVTTNRAGAFGNKPLYRLRILTRAGLEEFARNIGFIDARRNGVLARALDGAWEFNDVIPHQEELLEAVYAGPGRGSGPLRGKRGADRELYRNIQHYLPDVAAPRHLTRSRLAALADRHAPIRSSRLMWFLTNDQFYDQVETLEDGESPTLDLSVPANNTYIANGFVSHNTRRGANMGILRVDHPDVLKFVNCKRNGGITNFNISVAATNHFMEALAKDGEYDLIAPHTGAVAGRLRARAVFDEIVHAAWETGDPGLVFIDRANRWTCNPVPELGPLESTNPCVTGETLIATADGWRRVDGIAVGDSIATVDGVGRVARIEVYDDCPVYRVRLSDGCEIRATAAHQFHAFNKTSGSAGSFTFIPIRLDQLGVGDLVRIAPVPMPHNPVRDLPAGWTNRDYGFFVGLLLGDGCITPRTLGRNVVKVCVDAADEEWVEVVERVLTRTGSVVTRHAYNGRSMNLASPSQGSLALLVRESEVEPAYAHEKRIPLAYQQTNEQFLAGLLDGLFSTDGNVNLKGSHPLLRLTTTSKALALDVRRILLCFGIHARVYQKTTRDGVIDGRQIQSRHQRYELLVSGEGLAIFRDRIGLTHLRKAADLEVASRFPAYHGYWYAKVEAIVLDGVERVYDLYEPTTDTWITEGAVSRGCGEQWLYGYDACNLGSINVARFVKAGRGGKKEVNWPELERVTRLAVRFLDDVIEINPFPIAEITRMVRANRRVGLGVMGWADLLFELGIPYDSEEALDLAGRLMEAITRAGRDESKLLAEVRGPFPNYPRSIYRDGPPVRNSTVTTIAPTGTISIIANCSSGIEPIFALAFRHTANNRELTFVNPVFERVARERGFYSQELMDEVMAHGSVRGVAGVPADIQRVFVSAHEIEPDWHVRMQAAFQRNTDNAVSKTINLPHQATPEDVARSYLRAYELGCLGITVFRDGCKGGQVLNVGVKDTDKTQDLKQEPKGSSDPARESSASSPAQSSSRPAHSPARRVKPRPSIVNGYTRQIVAPEGKVNITLNSDDDGLLEVFVNVGKAGSDIAALAEALGRLISLCLRLPSTMVPEERAREIAHQLRGIGGSRSIGFGVKQVRSLPDAVAQALEQHLGVENGNGHKAEQLVAAGWTGNLCPECGCSTVVHVEGCKKCQACGFSEC